MTFRAVHAQWGAVFAHLPDLGCGQAWEAVWKVRPSAPLTCPECSHQMHAKVSPEPRRLRFYAHAPHAPNCALALETIDHHLLKLELANAARVAGAHAELEVRGPDGVWRADVLASDPGGSWRWALEAQLAAITDADITGRTERMHADGVSSIWFSDRPNVPWQGVVPSVHLAQAEDGEGLIVVGGLVRRGPCNCGDPGCRESCWQAVPATLVQFLGWAFVGRIVPYEERYHISGPVWSDPRYIWTAPRYAAEHEVATGYAGIRTRGAIFARQLSVSSRLRALARSSWVGACVGADGVEASVAE